MLPSEQCPEFHGSILETSLGPEVSATLNLLPVPSSVSLFKFDAWSHRLANCPLPDKEWFLDGLKNGFDIECFPRSLCPAKRNMPSSYDHPEIIDNYLKEEIEYGCIAGPFISPPSKTFK